MKHVLLVALFFFINIHITNAQVAFDEYVNNPVFAYSGVPGTFDQNRVYSHDLIKVDSEYKMYYSGVGGGNSVQIGLATSLDGINWERYPNNPIFKCAENAGPCSFSGGWSGYRVSVVSVDYLDGEYRLWYRGDNTSSNPIVSLGYATSQDGVNWTAYESNPIFPLQQQSGVIYHSVLKIDAGYRLYYTDFVNTGYYYVDSPDGVDWTAPVIKVGSELVHSVDNIGDKFIAVIGSSVAVSDDGLGFDFANPVATIQNNPGPDESQISFMLEGGLIKSWRVNYDGKVTWNFGNFSIYYATIQSEDVFGDGPEEPNPYPLYTQIKSPYPSLLATEEWAGDKFARGEDELAISGCETIAKCGCVITSLVMLGRSLGITSGIDGSYVNPSSLNTWLIANDGYAAGGILNFSVARKYFGIIEDGVQKTYLDWSDKHLTDAETKQKVASGTPVISQMNAYNSNGSGPFTHFVLTTAASSTGYLVNDPIWYNTVELDDNSTTTSYVQDYNNSIVNGRDLSYSAVPLEVARTLDAVMTGITTSVSESSSESALRIAAAEVMQVADFSLVSPSGKVLGDNESTLSGSYWKQYSKINLESDNISPDEFTLLSTGSLTEDEYELRVVENSFGIYNLSLLLHTASGEPVKFEVTSTTIPGQVDVYRLNVLTGDIELKSADLEFLKSTIDAEINDEKLNRFFQSWADKIFEEIADGKLSQAERHIETFSVLMEAKKVDSPALHNVLDKLSLQIKN